MSNQTNPLSKFDSMPGAYIIGAIATIIGVIFLLAPEMATITAIVLGLLCIGMFFWNPPFAEGLQPYEALVAVICIAVIAFPGVIQGGGLIMAISGIVLLWKHPKLPLLDK